MPVALVGVWVFLRLRESRRRVGRQSRAVGWAAQWAAVIVVGVGPILTFVVGPYPVLMGPVVLAGIRFSSSRLGPPMIDGAVGVAIAVSTLAVGVVVVVRGRRA